MDAALFERNLAIKTQELRHYVRNEFPHMAIRKAKRFIDGNFRAQGWQGRSFENWPAIHRKGTILVRTGRLRRGTKGEASPFQARIFNDVPYARFHNRGFRGTVTVKAHTRNTYAAIRVGTGRFTKSGTERTKTMHQIAGSTTVRTHTRNVNMPRRQFMPDAPGDSPVLENAIKRELINSLKTIFN